MDTSRSRGRCATGLEASKCGADVLVRLRQVRDRGEAGEDTSPTSERHTKSDKLGANAKAAGQEFAERLHAE